MTPLIINYNILGIKDTPDHQLQHKLGIKDTPGHQP